MDHVDLNIVRAVSYLGLAAAVSMVQLAIYDPTNEIIVEEIAKIEASETAITWEKESWETFGNTYENFKEFLIYASVPLLAVSTMLWFVFWRFRYAEHLVIASFVIVHQTFLFNVPVNIFAYIYEPLRGEATQYAIAFVSFIYQIWVYTQICWPYRIDLRITSIWRAVLAVLTWMFLFAALLTLAVLVFL